MDGIWRAEGGRAQEGTGEGRDFDENYRTCWSVLIRKTSGVKTVQVSEEMNFSGFIALPALGD
jgi:hypothetical protein